MSDKKISQLNSVTTPLAGTEEIPIVQSGTTKKVASNDLTVKNIRSNLTTGLLQVAGPGAGATRVMTTPDANFTSARTDAAQTFTSVQTFSSDIEVNGIDIGLGAGAIATNTALGVNALALNTTGDRNTAIGNGALDENTSGNRNTATGPSALGKNTTGTLNSAYGFNALGNQTTASSNCAFGFNAGAFTTTGAANTFIGETSGVQNVTGNGCTFVGTTAGNKSTVNDNTAVGLGALSETTTGSANTAVGGSSFGLTGGVLGLNTTGILNTAVGQRSLRLNTTGSNNTALGALAGDVITTGSRNVIIGRSSDTSSATANDEVVIGFDIVGKGDDTAFVGGVNGAFNEKNVTTWETVSDQRIKKNISYKLDGLYIIEQIQVRNFEYRKPEEIVDLSQSSAVKKEGVQIGVIAQELQQVLPECVFENSTGVLSVNTDSLIWYLVNAVKELSEKVDTLEAKLSQGI